MQGRVGAVSSAWLRARSPGPVGPRPLPTAIARDPALGAREAAWIDAVARVAGAVT
jgi:hypothetical protein